MLIDDEPAVRNILRMTIPWEQYQMTVTGEAASGAEALNTMEAAEPDIVIVDIKMPFMDGIEFSRIALKQNSELQVIMLTAYEDFELVRECLRIGVTDYFLKPVNTEQIKEKLRLLQSRVEDIQKKKESQIIISIENPEDTISRIHKYIHENYADPELNVASIANNFGFSASYLSRMYKKETGELLIDTVIRFRMEIAKTLAAKGDKMYQAAAKVGIPDANYFGKCFKKYYGENYSRYQKGSR